MSVQVKWIAHVNIRIPEGSEDTARAFWCDLLGFRELSKPPENTHPGCWFRAENFEVHVSPDHDFEPVTRAHTAFVVAGLTELVECLRDEGYTPSVTNQSDAGVISCFVSDPFGNRIEFLAPESDQARYLTERSKGFTRGVAS